MRHIILFALTLLLIATACKSTEPQSNAPVGPLNIAQVIEDNPERAERYSWIDESEYNNVWVIADEFPVLINGMRELQQRIRSTVSGNPSAGCEKLIGERVMYSFVVNEDGNVSKIKANLDQQSQCSELIEITLRLTKFTSGKVNGEPVSVFYNIPINFPSR